MVELGVLWTAHFATTTGVPGTGIIVFSEGNLYGGDERHYYFGKYKTLPNQSLEADLKIVHHYGPRDTVFGDEKQYSLKFRGKY
ncbi:MAG: hypothetical protein QMD53_07075 [Actinomycetota bacterium]|nr:hypothetical protein [Actinomycetota bacterium]